MGQIVIIEGADFVGKTTVIAALQELLSEAGYNVHVYREPGGNPHAEKIRDLIFDTAELQRAKNYRALLFYASRDITLRENVLPLAKSDRTIVIYDRFNLSSLVYQGMLAENLKYILALDGLIVGDVFETENIKVNKFLLTITPEEMARRIACRSENNSYDPANVEEAMRRQQAYKVLGSTREYVEVDNTMGGAVAAIMQQMQGELL